MIRIALLLSVVLASSVNAADAPEWKVGVAAVKITPQTPMWMAGYASRNKPSEGVTLDLFAKAMVVEDKQSTRLVVITYDLIGVPRAFRAAVETAVQEKYKVPPSCLLIGASHTHCGPELRVERIEQAGADKEQQRLGAGYMADLQVKLVALVGDAIKTLAPAKLDYLRARCGFAINRRRPVENGFRNAPHADGPVDHDVPVLRVTDAAGKPRAVLFGYACHNTTLGYYKFCGDYAGFAQKYLQEDTPGLTAMFITGCGADQNPYPRGTEARVMQHGRSLATAVQAALETVPKPVRGPLVCAAEEIKIDFAPPPSRERLEALTKDKNKYEASHAKRMLAELDKNGKIRDSYSYPVQVVRFGDDLVLVALAGEVVVDYSLRLKRELAGPAVWISGYCNDVFGYVPSLRVLKEGGYEGGGAMVYGSLPGPFADTIEERIVGKVKELAGKTRTSKP